MCAWACFMALGCAPASTGAESPRLLDAESVYQEILLPPTEFNGQPHLVVHGSKRMADGQKTTAAQPCLYLVIEWGCP
jgi:hypothetical protein